MNRAGIKTFAVAFVLGASVLLAPGMAAVVTPAQAAADAGDYRNAVMLLEKELTLTPPDNPNFRNLQWELLKNQLLGGMTAPAGKTWALLAAKPKPGEAATLLLCEAQLRYLEHDYAAARKKVEEFLASVKPDDPFRAEAVILLGRTCLQQQNYAQAVKSFDELNVATYPFAGDHAKSAFLLARLFAVLLSNDRANVSKEFAALEPYAQRPDVAPELEKLRLLQLMVENKYPDYLRRFNDLLPLLPPNSPDRLLYKTSLLAGAYCAGEKNFDGAVTAYKQAARFASTPAEEELPLRHAINLLLENNRKKEALEVITELLKFVPDTTDRMEIQLLAAKLEAETGTPVRAIAIYTRILRDANAPLRSRLLAAEQAAALEITAGNHAEALKLLIFMQEHAATAEEMQHANFLLGRYYFRTKAYKRAVDYFQKSQNSTEWEGQSLYYLLQSFMALEDYQSAMNAALKLGNSNADSTLATAAEFFRAELNVKLGDNAEALKLYEHFIQNAPESPYAPQAYWGAAKILFDGKSYSQAALLYLNFAGKYPQNELVPNALYKSMYSYFLAGRYDEMAYGANLLKERYPDSPYTIQAMFHEVDYYRALNEFAEARNTLDKIEKLSKNKDENISAQILYDRAMISYENNQAKNAIRELEKLVDTYPANLKCADALFLAGNISADLGEYARSIEYYRRAAELKPTGAFAAACKGRMGDGYFSLYSSEFNRKALDQALAIYESLANDPAQELSIRSQSMYKAGKCYELAEEYQKALDMYNELLYTARAGNAAKGNVAPVWISKGALNAINIHLQKGGHSSAREALRILELIKSMEIDAGEEFREIEQKIRNKYKM